MMDQVDGSKTTKQTSTDSHSAHNNKESHIASKDDNSQTAAKDDAPETYPEFESGSRLTVTPATDWPKLPSAIKVYKMSSKPRGLALIVDIQKFTDPDLKFREGSQIDSENLKELFTQLDFTVIMERNLRGNKMRQAIRKFSERPEHAEADMCIVAILSHGTEKEVYASDGVPIAKEKILEKFNNVECDDLVDKPKFFIIQSCQGESKDYGKQIDDGSAHESGEIPGNVEMSSGVKPRLRPSWEDMIIAHSTVPGYVSNRDDKTGSWFVQCLCDIFREQAADTDIRDMLDQVACRLATYESEAGTVQSFMYENRHFVKKLFFNPGLYQEKSK